MDLLQIGTQLLTEKLGGNGNTDNISGALSKMIGNGDNFDIGGLVSMLANNSEIQGMLSSWLGNGANDSISGGQISEIFGNDKLSEFASQLGVDNNTAANDLADIVPQMIDQGSSGGSLLDAVGGISGVADIAKKLF